MMKSELLSNNESKEIDNDIEKVLLEENYYNIKDKKLYLTTKNNVILLDFFYKLIFYIATGLLILVDLYIIAYFVTDDNDNFMREEYSDAIKSNLVISLILYILSLIFYILYKRNKNLLIKF